jgi:hypothetical protein
MKLQDSLAIAINRVARTHISYAVIKMHCGECDLVLPSTFKGEYIYLVSYEKDQIIVKDFQGNMVNVDQPIETVSKKHKGTNKSEKIQAIPDMPDITSEKVFSSNVESKPSISAADRETNNISTSETA